MSLSLPCRTALALFACLAVIAGCDSPEATTDEDAAISTGGAQWGAPGTPGSTGGGGGGVPGTGSDGGTTPDVTDTPANTDSSTSDAATSTTDGGGVPDAGPAGDWPCEPIDDEGEFWELCESGPESCIAVYEDGAGCDAVCGAAGMVCSAVYLSMGNCEKQDNIFIGCGNELGYVTAWCECAPDETVCEANCAGAECGDDGCDGSCGTCPGADACVGGICVEEGTDPEGCSGCVAPFNNCQEACQNLGMDNGECAAPGSTDPTNCCSCWSDAPAMEWTFYGSVADGGQHDAVRGPTDRIHMVSSRYYEFDVNGSVVVDEDVGDGHQASMDFPPAIAVGDDGTVHLVTRHDGNWDNGHTIRYRRRNAGGGWDQDYNFSSPVKRNYVVGAAWGGPGQVFMSVSQGGEDVWGNIQVWQAGEGSANQLGSLGGIWRADADSRMRGIDGHVFLVSGKPDGGGNAAYFLHGNPGGNLAGELDANKQTHVAGGDRTGFPDLYVDKTNHVHFAFGAEIEVYYNKYTSAGAKVFGSDIQIFSGLNSWHLKTGLSAVAGSDDGNKVLAVALRSDGGQGASDSDLLWAYSLDGGSSWSAQQDTDHNTDAGEGRSRPRIVAIGQTFFVFYGDKQNDGISLATIVL